MDDLYMVSMVDDEDNVFDAVVVGFENAKKIFDVGFNTHKHGYLYLFKAHIREDGLIEDIGDALMERWE